MYYWIMTLQEQMYGRSIRFATSTGTTDIVDPEARANSAYVESLRSAGFDQAVVMFYHVEPVPQAN